MMTLEHAFNAKDMESLVGKIIREQVLLVLNSFYHTKEVAVSFRRRNYRKNILNH
jgi:hypothetical protein